MGLNGAVLLRGQGVSSPPDSPEHQLVARSVAVLPVAAAAVITADAGGELQVAACSDERVESLAAVQIEAGSGSCLHKFRKGQPVAIADLRVAPYRRSAFATLALEHHYLSVDVLPLRFYEVSSGTESAGGELLGALLLLRGEVGGLEARDVAVGQALADIAAIGVARQRALVRSEVLNRQLQTALDTRVVIEQAKGILAERGSIDMDEAFNLLRSHARETRQRLSDWARAVVDGADTSAMLPSPH